MILNMENFIIRDLRQEDTEGIKAIYALYWPDQEFKDRLVHRMEDFLKQTPEMITSNFKYFVAEEEGQIVGVAGMRKAPIHMSQYVMGHHGCELYILAVKHKNRGVGKALVEKVIQAGKEEKQTDLVLYSGETHKDSYGFYEHLGFEIRDNNAIAPNGEKGVIFRMRL